LEVHVELDTKSKMFCTCANEFGAPPNARCCPVCLGLPGSMPAPNRQAVEYVIRTGLALNCAVAERCRFARKNYFYPDLAKNFQISQYDEPLTHDGHIELEVGGEAVHIRIKRAHLEEDTGKNIHLPDGRSLVEYNRCGVPLMEIVTEPDFTAPEQVREYLNMLRLILRYLGVSTADMEKGAMRAEPTINWIDRESGERTPKVEIKNLNSIKSVFDAVGYELARQHRAWQTDEEMFQETRRWDEAGGRTAPMRRKETADDYMYFPEPDLPPLAPAPEWVAEIRASLPELPVARAKRFVEQYGLPAYDAGVLTATREMADYFEEVTRLVQHASPKMVSNWIMRTVMGYLNRSGIKMAEYATLMSPIGTAILLNMLEEAEINYAQAEQLHAKIIQDAQLGKMIQDAQQIAEVAEAEGLTQVSDTGELERLVAEAIAANPQSVADYRGGKEKALGALVGAVMRASKGQANAGMVNKLLRKKLGEE
jgi:aspartyl-tRNA(Asn)/glutamyl-tRNA(Gln) amidotransferase subunit B